jgi:beta-lactam-binding protein with PASTA domain
VRLCNTYKAPVEGPQLVGMTVDAATQKAKETGFTGKIQTLQLSEFDASCKQGNVCGVDPGRWYLNQDHEMTLYVNKTVTISTPDQ